MMQTRHQRWADDAFSRTQERRKGEPANKYDILALRLPMLILNAGLAQAAVFIQEQGDPGKALLQDIGATMGLSGSDLVTRAREAPLPEYIVLTKDALAVSEWYRRFAQTPADTAGDGPANGGVHHEA